MWLIRYELHNPSVQLLVTSSTACNKCLTMYMTDKKSNNGYWYAPKSSTKFGNCNWQRSVSSNPEILQSLQDKRFEAIHRCTQSFTLGLLKVMLMSTYSEHEWTIVGPYCASPPIRTFQVMTLHSGILLNKSGTILLKYYHFLHTRCEQMRCPYTSNSSPTSRAWLWISFTHSTAPAIAGALTLVIHLLWTLPVPFGAGVERERERKNLWCHRVNMVLLHLQVRRGQANAHWISSDGKPLGSTMVGW